MFGIDLGINIGSVSCVTRKNEVVDSVVIESHAIKKKDLWERITLVAEHTVDALDTIYRGHPDIEIEQIVAIEEPVFNYRTRYPRAYFMSTCLYALVRNRLAKRGFKIYSINPHTVKFAAKKAFNKETIKKKYFGARKGTKHSGHLSKEGMIEAYKRLTGTEPNYHNKLGRETLADSFFIARAGIDQRKLRIS